MVTLAEANGGIPLTLYGVSPEELAEDVYYRRDFFELHRGSGFIDCIEGPSFHAGAVVRAIEGTDLEDLETPWGYGGPIATSHEQMRQGMWLWRQRQREAGRVAEFVRLHPFLNPLAVHDYYADIKFDRVTIAVDLSLPREQRRRVYSEGTKNRLRRAARSMTVVRLGIEHAEDFRRCYETGLDRNNALSAYYFGDDYYETILASPWATCLGGQLDGEIVSIACFLHTGIFCHYHLSGSTSDGRAKFAHYLLLDHAFDYFSEKGARLMHLGGGRTERPDDALLEFKKKFSRWRLAFYTAGAIYDPEAYAQLSTGDTRRFLNYRFSLTPRDEVGDVVLRKATIQDLTSYFQLKCDVSNIFWSGHVSPPDWRHLSAWYTALFNENMKREVFIAEMHSRVIGYAYLDDKNDHLESTLGVAASESNRARGRHLLMEMVKILRERNETRSVEAWIFKENIASVKAHEAAGFVLDSSRPTRSSNMPFVKNGNIQSCWVWRV